MDDINILAVIAAAIAAFAVGGLWYSPLLFLKPWCAATGLDPTKSLGNPVRVYGTTFILTLVAALSMHWLLGANPKFLPALNLSIIAGVGFVVSSLTINYQFSARTNTQLLIDAGFHIVRFMVMAQVLVLCA